MPKNWIAFKTKAARLLIKIQILLMAALAQMQTATDYEDQFKLTNAAGAKQYKLSK